MPDQNEVSLVGELAAAAEPHNLGEVERLEWRLTVLREQGGSDSINCYTTDPKLIARLASVAEGRRVQCQGAVRSRFWRSGGRTVATQEVEVLRLRLR